MDGGSAFPFRHDDGVLAGAHPVLGAADIADMADAAGQRHQPPAAEHRRHNGDVEQVPGAQPRIVGDQHIAR